MNSPKELAKLYNKNRVSEIKNGEYIKIQLSPDLNRTLKIMKAKTKRNDQS